MQTQAFSKARDMYICGVQCLQTEERGGHIFPRKIVQGAGDRKVRGGYKPPHTSYFH